jgi:class 3 adenylate cyclase/tetratricopeptide (TPR) repeat protein
MGHADRACAACGHENRAQARFCESCGRALERSCHACGTEIRATARFCDACGAVVAAAAPPTPARRDVRGYTPKHLTDRILTSRGAIEGERKQVTVFFADVTGSMELAEQVDPEEWHRILDRFFEILTEGVHRFEGTVNQYTGDGVMALFGAPLAHEDHAHRACYAALHLGEELRRFAQELKRERGLTFATRMGLNSGEVVVGTIGDDLRMDYTAQGQVVGIAARLQALADPGKAYVSEHTAALVEGFFALGNLGAFRLKGVTEPLRVFSLDGVGRMRTRLDVSRARGLSRFVGRRDEMAVLEGALARAIDGQAQVVGVVAEAGTGKSRLCGELGDRCRERGLRVHEARGVSHGKLLPFLPLLELLRAVFRLDESDSSRDARQKIAGSLVLLDRRFEEALPLLFEFLGVPDPERPAPIADPADQRRHLFGVIARLVRALGEREPSVLLLEDLHWFDDGTTTFVETLIEAITGTKTLLVLNFRPEFRAPWMEKASYQQLPLSPLGPAAVAELLDDLLGNDPSVAELRELVRGPTGGNPFFVEEAVQALIEAGSLQGSRGAYRLAGPLPTLRVPPTVQALLASRIDRLPAHARGVLQDASVIGKRFAKTTLRRVAGIADGDFDEALRVLRARDFVFEEELFPEVEYAFKHPLTQEVAYASQLADRRRLAHANVAQLLEEVGQAKLDEHAPLLAHHWEAAGEPLSAARWYRRAAEWSEDRQSASAAGYWGATRRLATAIGDTPESVRLRIAACLGLVRAADYDMFCSSDSSSAFAEGHRLAVDSDDRDSRVRLLLAYSALVLHDGNLERSAELLAEAESVAADVDDPELKFVVRGHSAFACLIRGEQRLALQRYDEAFRLLGDVTPSDRFVLRRYLGASANRLMIVAEAGRPDEARAEAERLLAIAEESRDLPYICIVHFCFFRLASFLGHSAEALRHAREAVETAERLGALGFRATARFSLGGAYLLMRSFDEAIAVFDDARSIASPDVHGAGQWAGLLARLAEAHLGRGDLDRALALSAEAVAAAEGVRRLGVADVLLGRARVLLTAGRVEDADEIERTIEAACEIVERCGATLYEASIHEERSRLARLLGRINEAERELAAARRAYREIGATGHLERLAAEAPREALLDAAN